MTRPTTQAAPGPSAYIGIRVPYHLAVWLREEAARRGLSQARLLADLLTNEASKENCFGDRVIK